VGEGFDGLKDGDEDPEARLRGARARERKGRRPKLKASATTVTMAKKLYADRTNSIADICRTLHISRATLYRYINTGGGNLAKP
jgi:DNA invertase Pin-like site-specific DNA recombinase